MVRNATGPAPLSRAELAIREKLGTKLRQWRLDEGLTQEQLGLRIDPHNQNAKAYVYRVERNDRGNFTAYGLMQHVRAIAERHTLTELLIESGVERWGRADLIAYVDDPTVAAVEADPHLTRQAKRLIVVQVKQGHADYREETASKLRNAERRDVARQVGWDDTLLNAWARLDAEQRQRAIEYITGTAAENETTTTPTPKGRRRKGS